MEPDQMVTDRAQGAEQETAEKAVETDLPDKYLIGEIQPLS